MVRQSLPADHCWPACQWICRASGPLPEAGGRHQRHEERPPQRPSAAILFLGQRAQAGRLFFISSTYKPYHSPDRPCAQQYAIDISCRVTALKWSRQCSCWREPASSLELRTLT